jgi:hypothetical protein
MFRSIRRLRPRHPRLVVVLLLAALPGRAIAAQGAITGIAGTVRDPLGAPLDGVTVEARNTETGYVTRAASNDAGRYALLGLPLGGPYVVLARRLG